MTAKRTPDMELSKSSQTSKHEEIGKTPKYREIIHMRLLQNLEL